MWSRLHPRINPSFGVAALALWLLAAPGAAAASEGPVPDAAETTVAFNADPSSRMGVPVFVNGQGPFRFLVDTGSDRTVVSQRLAASLQLPSAGTARMHSFTGVSQVGMVRIDKLGVSARVVDNITAAALHEADIGAEGLLGIDSLARQRLTLDFRSSIMTVGPGERPVRTEATPPGAVGVVVVRARPYAGQLVLTDARIGAMRVRVVIDTGATVSVANPELRRQLSRRRLADPSLMLLTGADGGSMVAEVLVVPELLIGNLRLGNLELAFADAHPFRIFRLDDVPAILLGMDAMSRMDQVSVDFASRTVRFVLGAPAQTRR